MPVDATRPTPTRRPQRKITEEELKDIELKRLRGMSGTGSDTGRCSDTTVFFSWDLQVNYRAPNADASNYDVTRRCRADRAVEEVARVSAPVVRHHRIRNALLVTKDFLGILSAGQGTRCVALC